MISANVEYGKIEQIKQLPGVADVVLEQQYEPAASENTVQPNMEISTGMTGTTTAWSTGYTGAGMRIAIIDTGLDMSHQSFDNGAYEYALEQNAARAKESVEAYKASLDLLDADEINEKLSRWRACISYTASRRSAGGCGVPARQTYSPPHF